MSDTIILDCNYLAHRARFSLRGLSSNEQGTGVIFGFLLQLQNLFEMFKTNDFIFCWDSESSVRKQMFSWYKKRKPRTPEEEKEFKDAIRQFSVLRKEVLPELGFRNIICKRGYESDDLFALLISQWVGDFTIVTADEDIYQLLGRCRIYNPNKNKIMTPSRFLKEFGISHKEWVKVKAIGGCKSDAVPGVPGVAEATAIKYLKGELKQDSKAFKTITSEEGKARIAENMQVVRLPLDTFDIGAKQENVLSMDGFLDICTRYSMKSMLNEDSLSVWESMLMGTDPHVDAIKKRKGLGL